MFCLQKNLNLEFVLFIKWVVIDSPDSISSRTLPKYVTVEYYLFFIFLYWMFKGLAFFNLTFTDKKIDLVLSSPKWMLSLLSTKKLLIKLKFLLSWISICLISLCWKIRQTRLVSFLYSYGFLIIKERHSWAIYFMQNKLNIGAMYQNMKMMR